MADSSKQRGLSAFGFLVPPTKKKRDDSTETEKPTKSEQKSQRQFADKWLKEFSWLALREGKMFCTVCETAPSLVGRTDFIGSGCVSFKRESLVLHNNSKHHRSIRDSVVSAKKSKSTVKDNFQRQERRKDDDNLNDMAIKMTTAYTIAKEELPFTKFKALVEMQRQNGVAIKDHYLNDVKCAEMISCI